MEKELYQVLARKYRPRLFSEVAGQQIVVKKLQQAILSKRIPHAFLFAGPRGVGKTTIARIFARALNCIDGPAIEPCNKCIFCKEISDGTSMDFLEIDGASNRGIEEIRALREAVSLQPAKARYKIYLIDEVHMLTNEAFNALLKTLEEPPEYVKFIFATTAPEKIPATIVSRCQRYEFKPLSFEEISGMIKKIVENEGFSIQQQAMKKLIEAGSGSFRDILGYLDQMMVLADGNSIDLKLASQVLGLTSGETVWEFLKIIVGGDIKEVILTLHRIVSEGKDITNLLGMMARKMQLVIWNHYGINIFDEEIDRQYFDFFKDIDVDKIVKALESVMETKEKIRYEPLELVLAELLCFKLVELLKMPLKEKEKPVEKNIDNVEQKEIPAIEKNIAISVPEGGDDFTTIIQNWDEILLKIKKSKPLLYAALREGRPVKCENKCLHVVFGENYSFLCQRVMENKTVVEKVLEKIFGSSYTINCAVSASEKKIPLKQRSEVKEIIEFMGGGEIVETED